jgi:hypothetical protein
MAGEQNIRNAFDFLSQCAGTGCSFTVAELARASGWTVNNTKTNLQKRLSGLVRKDRDSYVASPEILRVRLEDFKDLFRQKQRLFGDYAFQITPSVLIYEFFMPLAREEQLREGLDNLFFLDTVRQRIREIGATRIRDTLKLLPGTPDEATIDLVVQFVETTIKGYSLYLVSGRFRQGGLDTREEVATRLPSLGPYIIDETTAVVRFILPVETPGEEPRQMVLFEPAEMASRPEERAEQVRWLFLNIFAEAVARVVRKEDEIWLVESGMRSALYRWLRRE